MSVSANGMNKLAVFLALVIGSPTCVISASEDIQSWFLDDGTEVLLLEDYRAPLVSIEINFNVNRLMPWAVKNSAQAAFACQMMDNDRQIEREIEESGVFISTSMGWGRARIGGSSLSHDFPQLIGLIRKVIENRDYSRKELQKWHSDRVISWRSTTTNPRTLLNQAALKLLYPTADDPRNTLYDRPSSFSRSAERLARTRDIVLSTPSRNIAVSGSVTREELHDLIRKLLPEVKESSRFGDTANRPPLHARSKTIEMKNLTQVYMALVRDSCHSYTMTIPHI